MICPKCGAGIKDGDNFCEECGASLKKAASGINSPQEAFPESEIVIYDKDLAAATNKGRRHPTNEDAGTVAKAENGDVILLVADGVSSSVNATSGSKKAIGVIKDILVKECDSAKQAVISAIRSANECVKSLPFETREDGLYGPETTIVAALLQDCTMTVGWVGDSRAYVLNAEEQEQVQLTVDDSWVELVVAEGTMTREEASLDRRAHCVTQVLGMHDQEAKAHILEYKLKKGDMVLLCSDGLWNYFQGEKALLNTINAFGINSEAAHICEHLVGLANAAGGHDNITAALYRYKETIK